MSKTPQQQVTIKEDDAVLTASEIRACLLFALSRLANSLDVSDAERKKALVLGRCLNTENVVEAKP